jgi:hypothetical protein
LTFRSFSYRYAFGTGIQNSYVFKDDFVGLFSSHGAKINYWLKLGNDLRKKYKLEEKFKSEYTSGIIKRYQRFGTQNDKYGSF